MSDTNARSILRSKWKYAIVLALLVGPYYVVTFRRTKHYIDEHKKENGIWTAASGNISAISKKEDTINTTIGSSLLLNQNSSSSDPTTLTSPISTNESVHDDQKVDIERNNETRLIKTTRNDDIHNSTVALLPLLPWEQEQVDVFTKFPNKTRSELLDLWGLSCKVPPGVPRFCCLGTANLIRSGKQRSYCADAFQPKNRSPLLADVEFFLEGTSNGCDVCRIMEVARTNKLNIAFLGDSITQQTFHGLACELARRSYGVDVTSPEWERVLATRNFGRIADVTRLEVHSPLWEEGEKVNVTVFKQYMPLLDHPKDIPAVLDFADVIVLGFGLHYQGPNVSVTSRILKDYSQYLETVQRYLKNQTSNARPPKLLIHRETAAQHFNTTEEGSWVKGNSGICVPHKREFIPSIRERALTQVFMAAKFLNVYAAPPFKYEKDTNSSSLLVSRASEGPELDLWMIPFYNFTTRQYMTHPGNPDNRDCTHYCNTPIFWSPIWHGIRRAMDIKWPT